MKKTELDSFDRAVMTTIENMIRKVLPSGSGFDGEWGIEMDLTKGLVKCSSTFHCMNENGYYDGWCNFNVTIKLGDAEYWRLTFCSDADRRLAAKYDLRDYIEQTIWEAFYEMY
jgi:hypothetical protein